MIPQFNRRQFLQLGTSAAALLSAGQLSLAAEQKVRVKTYTYKTVGKLQIKADVHRPDDDVMRPVVVWIHGGALIMGHRQGISGRMKKMLLYIDGDHASVNVVQQAVSCG